MKKKLWDIGLFGLIVLEWSGEGGQRKTFLLDESYKVELCST